jgi:AcrR family transcriptional regulator
MITLLKYSDLVEARMKEGPRKKKGDRTRDRLKVATIRILEEEGSGIPRISDICEKAGVSVGTFYLYFESNDEIVHDVLSGWVDTIRGHAPPSEGYEDAYEAMYVGSKRLIELYAVNSGLMQCLWRLRDRNTEFAKIWERNSLAWYQGVRSAVLDHSDVTELRESSYTLSFYVISSMMDEFLRTLFVSRDPDLHKTIQDTSITTDEMAEYLAVVWYRILYGQDPADGKRRLKYLPNIKPLDKPK